MKSAKKARLKLQKDGQDARLLLPASLSQQASCLILCRVSDAGNDETLDALRRPAAEAPRHEIAVGSAAGVGRGGR